MPYSFAIGSLRVLQGEIEAGEQQECTCKEAFAGCTPSFVFSVAGQVGFRTSLQHLLTCNKKDCASLRKRTREAIQEKIRWLFEEDALLGCIHIQPLIYGAKRPVNLARQGNFKVVSHHLATCPHENCSRLRRSLLLTVRKRISPNAQSD